MRETTGLPGGVSCSLLQNAPGQMRETTGLPGGVSCSLLQNRAGTDERTTGLPGGVSCSLLQNAPGQMRDATGLPGGVSCSLLQNRAAMNERFQLRFSSERHFLCYGGLFVAASLKDHRASRWDVHLVSGVVL